MRVHFLLPLVAALALPVHAQSPAQTFPAAAQDIAQRNVVNGLESEINRLTDQKNALVASMERTEKSLADLQQSVEKLTQANTKLQAEKQTLESTTATARAPATS